ncbi:hypothetical protein BKA65DRAFT_521316 [Rhexocercosporidium sp. MPI-PUGE-AT-0058]|nr:hypothetical protein BKA65DRAFT_521316 [Rhexocercosporidium sp. MPI-PUGE-AT-0058]
MENTGRISLPWRFATKANRRLRPPYLSKTTGRFSLSTILMSFLEAALNVASILGASDPKLLVGFHYALRQKPNGIATICPEQKLLVDFHYPDYIMFSTRKRRSGGPPVLTDTCCWATIASSMDGVKSPGGKEKCCSGSLNAEVGQARPQLL